jgi:S1-C subfamily serine protease
MKRVLATFFLMVVLISNGCAKVDFDHPIRVTPTEEEYVELVRELKKSTVSLRGFQVGIELSLGSGMIFAKEPSPNGSTFYYVVTNNHVVDDITGILIDTDFDRSEHGDIYLTAPQDYASFEDIAIVRFESDFEYPIIKIVPLEEEKQIGVTVGQYVFGIGSPSTKDNLNLVTNIGVISAVDSRYIVHTANINPGNSGGPLFSYDGTFIGINSSRLERINGEMIYLVSDAIDANQVARLINNLFENRVPKLGIIITEMSNFMQIDKDDRFEWDPQDYVDPLIEGLVILEVGSTRPSFGILQMYDVITHINGVKVTTRDQLAEVVGTIEIGNVYEFTVVRKHEFLPTYEELTLEVEITHV